MKKFHLALVVVGLSVVFSQTCEARYFPGYKVTHVEGKTVTIQEKDKEPIILEIKRKKFKVGDPVSYDPKKKKIIRDDGGC